MLVETIRVDGIMVFSPPWPHDLPDPDDKPFLEVAAAARAALVTGNVRDFPARLRESVLVHTPRGFLEVLRAETYRNLAGNLQP